MPGVLRPCVADIPDYSEDETVELNPSDLALLAIFEGYV
jgi:hypothetical protein